MQYKETPSYKPKRRFGCLATFTFLFLLVSALSFFGANEGPHSVNKRESSAQFCNVLKKYVRESTEALAQYGTVLSASDVASVLNRHGTALATGFNVEMAGSAERLDAIRSAGEQLLRLRVAILDGGDFQKPTNQFKLDAQKIEDSCN